MTQEITGGAEQARSFVGRLMEDEDLQARADEAYIQVLLDLAAEEGYECAPFELREALEAMSALEEDLSDQELELVAGGTNIESKLEILDPVDPDPGKGKAKNQPCPCGSGKKFKHCCGATHP